MKRSQNWQKLRKGTKVHVAGDPDVGMPSWKGVVVKVHPPKYGGKGRLPYQSVSVKDKQGEIEEVPIQYVKSEKTIEEEWNDYPRE